MSFHAPQPALLDNVRHAGLRLHTGHSAALGDAVMSALATPDEFRSLQAHYPLAFQKTADGAFQPVALFGLAEGENLFLADGGWDAPVLPLSIRRQPFLIGRGGAAGEQLLVHIDLAHPRIAPAGQGQPVFLPLGGPSELLDEATSVLLALHEGVQQAQALVAALLAHQLLESFVLDVEAGDGSQGRLSGLYTVHEERLAALDGAALEGLQRAGHLMAIYMVVASVGRFRDLVERRQRAGR